MPKEKGYGASKMKPSKRRSVFKLTKTKHNPMFKARKKSY